MKTKITIITDGSLSHDLLKLLADYTAINNNANVSIETIEDKAKPPLPCQKDNIKTIGVTDFNLPRRIDVNEVLTEIKPYLLENGTVFETKEGVFEVVDKSKYGGRQALWARNLHSGKYIGFMKAFNFKNIKIIKK